jgi:hypothetical protein
MGRLTRLSKLTVADNLLVDLPVSMGHCRGIRWLDLSRNPIRNQKMLERANVGTDHLIDWLERRMFALIDFDASSVFNDGLAEQNEYGRTIRPATSPQVTPTSSARLSPVLQASASPTSPVLPRAALSTSEPDGSNMMNTSTAALPRVGTFGARQHQHQHPQQQQQRLAQSGSMDSHPTQLEMLKAEYAAARSHSAGALPSSVQMSEMPQAQRLSMYMRSQKHQQAGAGSAIQNDPEIQALLQVGSPVLVRSLRACARLSVSVSVSGVSGVSGMSGVSPSPSSCAHSALLFLFVPHVVAYSRCCWRSSPLHLSAAATTECTSTAPGHTVSAGVRSCADPTASDTHSLAARSCSGQRSRSLGGTGAARTLPCGTH